MAQESRAAFRLADTFGSAGKARMHESGVATLRASSYRSTALTLATSLTTATPGSPVAMPCNNSAIWCAGEVFGGDKHDYQRLKNRPFD